MNFIKKSNYSYHFFLFLTLGLFISNNSRGRENIRFVQPEVQLIIFRHGSDMIKYPGRALLFYDTTGQSEQFNIPYEYNSVIFLLDTLGTNRGLLYRFFLEGHEHDWQDAVPYAIKEYSNLSPGYYSFHVGLGRDGKDNRHIAIYKFRILKPFYRTGIAWFLYLVLAILMFITFLKIQNFRFAKEKFRLERIINERTDELVKEKDKSERLLANVLPRDTANELKTKGKASKKKYKMVTVLFSDIQGFTKIAEQMNPEKLIDELDSFFFHFDSVVEKFNTEKIKTIGDAYMCAGGIPEKNRTNPVEVVMAALEMQQYMADLHEQARKDKTNIWDIRIGIHTGSVIAGVVGHKKLSYDIWGDTVNTASRMESSGEAGKVNISGSTYQLVKDFFICDYRGKMPVKYKGEIDMYFVKGIRPELLNRETATPNKEFVINLQMLRLNDLEDNILEKIDVEAGDKLKFHNRKHTVNVYTQVELLARAEKVKEEDILLLRTAGLMHDIGYLSEPENPLQASCDITKSLLQSYKYSEEQIDKICKLIKATSNDYGARNLLEKIIYDANMNYMGRIDFPEISLNIFLELKAFNKVGSFIEWKKGYAEILKTHEFYTETAKLLRDVDKKEQLKKLDSLKEPG